jgi:hypothetical protein
MFPFIIHSDAMAKRERELSIITPNRGSTFGWWRAFQVTTSLQNLWDGMGQIYKGELCDRLWRPTLVIFSKSLVE